MSKTRDRIRESSLRYKQSLGQNFIYDDGLLAALVAEAGVTPSEDVLEIGPGCGSLTKHLCDAAHHVLSVELDERLVPLLSAFMAERDNFTLVQGDVMALDLHQVTEGLRKPFAVVANIPYYITAPIISHLLGEIDDLDNKNRNSISEIVLMVQEEVARRIVATEKSSSKQYGLLTILSQFWADCEIIRILFSGSKMQE